jgi:hypothetical protein
LPVEPAAASDDASIQWIDCLGWLDISGGIVNQGVFSPRVPLGFDHQLL